MGHVMSVSGTMISFTSSSTKGADGINHADDVCNSDLLSQHVDVKDILRSEKLRYWEVGQRGQVELSHEDRIFMKMEEARGVGFITAATIVRSASSLKCCGGNASTNTSDAETSSGRSRTGGGETKFDTRSAALSLLPADTPARLRPATSASNQRATGMPMDPSPPIPTLMVFVMVLCP